MDPIKNPFSPGAGTPPPELVGRDSILEEARILLGRVKLKRPEKSMLLTGLRGVGKTVLLNEIERLAVAEGYRTVSIEAIEDRYLGEMLAPHLRKLLLELDRLAGAGDKAKRALAVLRSFIGSIKVTIDGTSYGLDIEPEKGSADSGNLEIDLPQLFEVQYFDQQELGALIMAMHRIQQRQLPLVLLGAGLPVLPGLAAEAKSYAERLFNFPDIGALTRAEAGRAVEEPMKAAGVVIDAAALDEIFRMTKGYPYFLQEWGYQTWNLATSSPISEQVAQAAAEKSVPRLDANFFRARYQRLTPNETRTLRAMADLGPGPHRTADVAERLGILINSMGPVRAQLIRKGMIYSPAHGELAFTVPLFDEFMIRQLPTFE
jgi:hypothetical protein